MKIVILSGSPGTGKTTVARLLAEHSPHDKAVHIELDDYWQYIRKGYIDPWLTGSGDQNETVIGAAAASAEVFCNGGYDVYVAGVIGPWFLRPWLALADKGVDVRYIILRPDEETTVGRAAERRQNEFFPLDGEVVRKLWHSFADLGEYEANVYDNSRATADEVMRELQQRLNREQYRLRGAE